MIKKTSLLFIIFSMPFCANAQDTLQNLYREALDNPSIKQAQAQSTINQAQRRQLFGTTLPSLDVKYSINRNLSGDSFTSAEVNRFTLTLNQSIFNLQTWHRLDQIRNLIAESHVREKIAKQSLYLNIAAAYISVLDAEARLELAKKEALVSQRLAGRANAFFRAGNGRKVDVLQANASFNLSKSTQISTENDKRIALASLSALVGRSVEQITPLNLDIDILQSDADYAGQLQLNNISLQAQKLSLAASEYNLKATQNTLYPTAEISLEHTHLDYVNETAILSDNSVNSINFSIDWKFSLTNYGNIDEVTAQHQQAKHIYNALRRQLQEQLQKLLISIDTAKKQIPALLSLTQAQEEALISTEESHKAGLSDLIDVINASRDLTSAKSNLHRTRLKLWLDYVQLNQLTTHLKI